MKNTSLTFYIKNYRLVLKELLSILKTPFCATSLKDFLVFLFHTIYKISFVLLQFVSPRIYQLVKLRFDKGMIRDTRYLFTVNCFIAGVLTITCTSFRASSSKFRLGSKYKKDIFIDIGAHIGRYSVLLASKFRKVIFIEPEPSNFDVLKRNIKMNNLKNVITLPCGCYGENCQLKLYLSETNMGAHSIHKENRKKSVIIRVRKLDDIIKELGIEWEEVGLVKIDVEGAELEVLKGAETLIKKGDSRLIIETGMPKEVESFLKEFHYKLVAEDMSHANFLFQK